MADKPPRACTIAKEMTSRLEKKNRRMKTINRDCIIGNGIYKGRRKKRSYHNVSTHLLVYRCAIPL
jgi:hypothetical protein